MVGLMFSSAKSALVDSRPAALAGAEIPVHAAVSELRGETSLLRAAHAARQGAVERHEHSGCRRARLAGGADRACKSKQATSAGGPRDERPAGQFGSHQVLLTRDEAASSQLSAAALHIPLFFKAYRDRLGGRRVRPTSVLPRKSMSLMPIALV